ncbi:MAG: iron-sulfur cluster repair di-iron protein [Legionellales bacterium]|nr:iron-sulfur cluster repair di-iron protein [Legionellales bacterium]
METETVSFNNETYSCNECCKLAPTPNAYTFEMADYVLHFCGLDCYEQWLKKDLVVNDDYPPVLDKTVGNLVKEHPALAKVFEALSIDYCCGGNVTLKEICTRHNLLPSTVIKQIFSVLHENKESSEQRLDELSTSELIQHILDKHHNYLHTALPRLKILMDKVVKAHSKNHPELLPMNDLYTAFYREMEQHLLLEENTVFPQLLKIGSTNHSNEFTEVEIKKYINELKEEHQKAGDDLKSLRQLSHYYLLPKDACNTYRALLSGLAEMEKDIFQHVHLENNILLPRIINMIQSTHA